MQEAFCKMRNQVIKKAINIEKREKYLKRSREPDTNRWVHSRRSRGRSAGRSRSVPGPRSMKRNTAFFDVPTVPSVPSVPIVPIVPFQ
jgi:hypothetical protein